MPGSLYMTQLTQEKLLLQILVNVIQGNLDMHNAGKQCVAMLWYDHRQPMAGTHSVVFICIIQHTLLLIIITNNNLWTFVFVKSFFVIIQLIHFKSWWELLNSTGKCGAETCHKRIAHKLTYIFSLSKEKTKLIGFWINAIDTQSTIYLQLLLQQLRIQII